jgi:hypothetical protein
LSVYRILPHVVCQLKYGPVAVGGVSVALQFADNAYMFPLQRNGRTRRHHEICLPYTVTVAKSEVTGGDTTFSNHRRKLASLGLSERSCGNVTSASELREGRSDSFAYFPVLLVEVVDIQRERVIFQITHNTSSWKRPHRSTFLTTESNNSSYSSPFILDLPVLLGCAELKEWSRTQFEFMESGVESETFEVGFAGGVEGSII